ncbi:GTP-binding protein 1 [Entophlyctis sp. JEL0112]|nr:GTP-binding protein 1 [Entophlyctis sp. JEL0112]
MSSPFASAAAAASAIAQRLTAASVAADNPPSPAAGLPEPPGPDPDWHHDDDDDDEANDDAIVNALQSASLTRKGLYVAQPHGPVADFAGLSALVAARVAEGHGEAVLEIGVEDDGSTMLFTEPQYKEAIANVRKAADAINCDVSVLMERRYPVLQMSNNWVTFSSLDIPPHLASSSDSSENVSPDTTVPPQDSKANIQVGKSTDAKSAYVAQQEETPYYYCHVLIRKRHGQVEDVTELRVAVVGNVDAGKSTLLGVLTKNVLDDGRGKARVNLFKHKHEIETGRTSSVGLEIMGFTSTGGVVTPESVYGATAAAAGKQKLTWDDVISFIDLAGHEKYLKTTVFGMTGCSPDFVMLMIGANAGIIGMTKEHLGLALALNVPVYICITKIDMCPPNVLESTIKQLTKILKSSGCRKIPMFINTVGDVLVTAGNFVSERICPIFQVSNITGQGLDLLKLFLNVLRSNSLGNYNPSAPVEYQITDTFSVPGVGTVVNGTLVNGIVHVGDSLLIGPDSTGHFTPTIVKSIQRKRVSVPLASAGQSASFALKKVKRANLRKGMVMVSRAADARAYFEFEAEVLVLYHSTTISTKYQAMLHCGGVRQTAKIVGMDRGVLRTGDRALVQFRFMRNPEFLKVGGRLLFREGRTKGVGKVVRLGPKTSVAPDEAGAK